MMLNGRLELHDVADTEALCRSVLNDHLTTGARTANGHTGPSSLNPDDYDDALSYLIAEAWKASQRFRTQDDGRGTNRFSGYLVSILHRRVVDWKRERYGSTRYVPRPIVELTDDERHLVAQHVDFTAPEVLDLVNEAQISEPRRKTLRMIVIPLVFEQQTVEEYAQRSGKPLSQVNAELVRLRRELEAKELLAA